MMPHHRAHDRRAAAARARRRCAKGRSRSARRAARAVFTVVLPAALPGILTGIMLALARIAGETAPLLFTAFNNRFFSTRLDQPISTLTVQVYTYAISPYDDWHRQAWAGALVLVVDGPRLLGAGASGDPPAGADAGGTMSRSPAEAPEDSSPAGWVEGTWHLKTTRSGISTKSSTPSAADARNGTPREGARRRSHAGTRRTRRRCARCRGKRRWGHQPAASRNRRPLLQAPRPPSADGGRPAGVVAI